MSYFCTAANAATWRFLDVAFPTASHENEILFLFLLVAIFLILDTSCSPLVLCNECLLTWGTWSNLFLTACFCRQPSRSHLRILNRRRLGRSNWERGRTVEALKMPTYLCHGFRWHRRAIRIFVILQNLDDAAPDWIIGRATSSAILSELHELYKFLPEPLAPETPPTPKAKPEIHHDDDLSLPPPRVPPSEDHVLLHSWSAVKLLEEYDPDDLTRVSRPYAYVADYVVRIDLSVDVVGEMAKYESTVGKTNGWFGKLKDELQDGEEIRWFIVVCGDENRDAPTEDGESSHTESVLESTRRTITPFEGLDFGFDKPPETPQVLPPPISSLNEPSIFKTESSSERPSTSNGPSIGGGPDAFPEPVTPKRLKKRKSVAAGLRKMFGKKKDEMAKSND